MIAANPEINTVAPAGEFGAAEQSRGCWYAAYTCVHHEKRVAQQLAEREISCFLPLYRSVRRWKDRRRELDLALFPGYVFVRMELKDRLTVLQLPSVVHFVTFSGRPVAIPDPEINALRDGLAANLRAQPHPYLTVGRRARVRSGPMAGIEGILVRKKDRLRFVLSVELIRRSVAVEVDSADIEPL